MHKVKDQVLFNSYFSFGDGDGGGTIFAMAFSYVYVLVFTVLLAANLNPLAIPVFVIPTGFLFYMRGKYYQYKKSINSYSDQPLITEVVKNFHRWEKDDKIRIPYYGAFNSNSRNSIKGYFKGIKDDGSVVIEVDSGRQPKEDFSGKKLYKPKLYEIPPKLFEENDFRNYSLRERMKENQEEEIQKELEASTLNDALKEAKKDLEVENV